MSSENPRIIARATPVGTRRLRAVPAGQAAVPTAAPEGPGRIVAPPGGEARTLTGLNGFLESARRQGAELIAVTPRPSPLRGLDGRAGVLGVLSGSAVSDADLIELLDLGPGRCTFAIETDIVLQERAWST